MILDPALFLLTEHDVPDGFSRVVDGDKSDRLDRVEVKFRTFVRGDAVIHCGVYAAPSAEIAMALLMQMREDFRSVGAELQAVLDLGSEAYSASVFPAGATIQRIVLFRSETLTVAVHYTDDAALFAVDDVVEMARRIVQKEHQAHRDDPVAWLS